MYLFHYDLDANCARAAGLPVFSPGLPNSREWNVSGSTVATLQNQNHTVEKFRGVLMTYLLLFTDNRNSFP